MNSIFLRLFLSFCAAAGAVLFGVITAYLAANPNLLAFDWPDLGRGAIIASARAAISAYQQGGSTHAARYLESLAADTGLQAALFNPEGKHLAGSRAGAGLLLELAQQPENQLLLRPRDRLAGVRLRAGSGAFAFVAAVPRREPSGAWSQLLVASLGIVGGLMCLALARHLALPILHLRALTSRFAAGDLTARVELPHLLGRRDEIGGLARDFNHMAEKIAGLVGAQQRLIADASHELRSPITRLNLALGLLRRGAGSEFRGSLSRMERELERLEAMVGQLLTLSRLEALEKAPRLEPLDLARLVQEIAGDADFEAASTDRTVRLAELARCTARGDRDLLRSAVENVVRNAVKYTDPGTEVTIRLLFDEQARTATILVEDQGPGAPEDSLSRLFDPFYRVDGARTRASGGAGLGLAITRQVVHLHGGSARALNREPRGLEMRITLPAEPGSEC